MKTPSELADEQMQAFTVTYDEDVEECSSSFIHEQIIEAIEADREQRHEVDDALTAWLEVVDNMTLGPLHHFTCMEAEALARLAVAARGGDVSEGGEIIRSHIEDNDGDGEERDELVAHLEKHPGLASFVAEQLAKFDDERG